MDPTIYQISQLMYKIQELTEELENADELLEQFFECDLSELTEQKLIEEKQNKKWIQKAIKKPGALRKSLKVKSGKDIPVSKLKKAAEKGGKMGKRARLALTLRKLNEETHTHGLGSFDAPYPSKEFAELHKRFKGLNAHHQLEPQDSATKAARDAALKEVLAHPDYNAYDQAVNRKLGIEDGEE